MDLKDNKILNFRDLGNYITKDGRHIKKGLFLRGGALMNLDEDDKKFIDSLKLRHIFDFRPAPEVIRKGNLYYPSGVAYQNISAFSDEQLSRTNLTDFSEENIMAHEAWLAEMYGELPFNNKAYKAVFECIKNDDLPVYFHCSSGKDRTGVLAALILEMFGVERQEIYRDYMLSYDIMVRHNAGKKLRRFMLVYPEWLDNTFKALDRAYPDSAVYFKVEYGIDVEEMKKKYLEA